MGKHLFELADYKAYNAEIRRKRASLDAKWGLEVDSDDDMARWTTQPAYIAELSKIVRETYVFYAAEDARLLSERAQAQSD